MAQRSNPVEKKARFAVTGYSPTQMLAIGQTVSDDIKTRILSAQDVHDAPAPALKPNYAKWKGRKAPPAIRNWRLTGNTLGAMGVLSESINKAVIGFTSGKAAQVAFINQARARQFGVSPRNPAALTNAVHDAGAPIKVEVF